MLVGKHQKSQLLTLLRFISSSRMRRFLHFLQTVFYELVIHGKPESHVRPVLHSAQWFCHSFGLITRVEGVMWLLEEAELSFLHSAHPTLPVLREPDCG